VVTMPAVELLAQELASGSVTLVQLYEAYTLGARQAKPEMSDEQLKLVQAELRGRLQFAWELARRANIAARKA